MMRIMRSEVVIGVSILPTRVLITTTERSRRNKTVLIR
jgi:hypothetical protein